MTETQSPAIRKVHRARHTCKRCGRERDYYIARLLGMCNDCALAEIPDKARQYFAHPPRALPTSVRSYLFSRRTI